MTLLFTTPMPVSRRFRQSTFAPSGAVTRAVDGVDLVDEVDENRARGQIHGFLADCLFCCGE